MNSARVDEEIQEKGETNPAFLDINQDDIQTTTPTANTEPEPPKALSQENEDKEDKKSDKESPRKLRPVQLLKFADRYDVVLMLVGTVASIVGGLCTPIMFYSYSDVVSAFIYRSIYRKINNRTISLSLQYKFGPDEVQDIHRMIRDDYAIPFVFIGVAILILSFIYNMCWTVSGERQTGRIRKMYFRSLLDHSVTWFDLNNTKAIASNFTSDLEAVGRGVGRSFGTVIYWISMWLGSIVVALILLWKLSLACTAFLPLNIFITVMLSRILTRVTAKEKETYGSAGAIVEEVFSAIKTVVAFNGQEKEINRYKANLQKAEKQIVLGGMVQGLALSIATFVFLSVASVGIWYGIELFIVDNIEPGKVLATLVSVSFSSLSLITLMRHSGDIVIAREAACRIFPVIDETTLSGQQTRKTPAVSPDVTTCSGDIEVNNLTFSYPARPDVKVLKNVSFTIESGKTTAIVGHSGCGKSTLAQLLEGFYDPTEGSIYFGGKDLKELDRKWLRRQIGFVGQEPVLFSTSISENIRFGNMDAREEEVVNAAAIANAHSFIRKMPKGYDTFVGDSGCQLSGGQKQRIAVARALIRNPSILLLDEATSALDSASESLVQQAIDKAKVGRTTIIIAHRLSTVIGADKIVVMKDGKIEAQGTHRELIAQGGYYTSLVKNQVGPSLHSEGLSNSTEVHVDASTPSNDLCNVIDENVSEVKPTVPTIKSPMRRVLALMRPEKFLVVVGVLFSSMFAVAIPAQAIAVTESLIVFQESPEESRQAVKHIVGIVMGIGCAVLVLRVIGVYTLSVASARLTTRVREKLFTAIIYQEIEYFEKQENRVGLLTTRMSSDAIAIHGVSAMKLASNLEGIMGLLFVIVLAFVYSWKLCLVLLVITPVAFVGNFLLARQPNTQTDLKSNKSEENTGQIVQECLNNVRLVFSFTSEDYLSKRFGKFASELQRYNIRRGIRNSVIAGIADSTVIFFFSVALTYGSFLVQYEGLDFQYLFRVLMLLNQASILLGRVSGLSPDYVKASVAAAQVFSVIDQNKNGKAKYEEGITKDDFRGEMQMTDVSFHYPTRSNIPVLRNVSLTVLPGRKLALLGSSGCGKTTIVSLIEKFYHTISGAVLADGEDIGKLNNLWYRAQIGLVPQEPVVFDRSIAENIKYGDNSRDVSMHEVIEAARIANLHDFVKALPQGYDTICGNNGTQLSGGEKQRVAIARAIIRNPKILILDEATSALDSYNEKLVQESLERASEGRTTIIIAHRLSTIKNCDQIAVIQNGYVSELGTHDELLHQQGIYYKMLQAQAS